MERCLIGSRVHCIEPCYFRLALVTFEGHFGNTLTVVTLWLRDLFAIAKFLVCIWCKSSCGCVQKSRNMELLEQELNDPTSPRPPPVPPRPAVVKDARKTTLPSMHSSSAPSIMTPAGSTMTSRSPGNQSVSSVCEDREERAEPRYVSASQVQRPPKSAAAAASQLRVNSRRPGLDRARTCDEKTSSDNPPALPPPRKFSLQFDSVGQSTGSEIRTRSCSPGQQPQQDEEQSSIRQHRDSPDPPTNRARSADTSPRSSPHGKHT